MSALVYDQIVPLIVVLSIAAGLSGFIAGLLGVGGGIIMVPALYYAFGELGYNEELLMHMAIATSLAIIIPTSTVSAISHMKYKAVNFDLVKTFGLSVAIGILVGTFVATNSKTPQLLLMFSTLIMCWGAAFGYFNGLILVYPKGTLFGGYEPLEHLKAYLVFVGKFQQAMTERNEITHSFTLILHLLIYYLH